MKKLFLLAAATFLTAATFAQSDKYVASMKANIAAIDSSFKNPQNLLDLANKFERIATAEKTQWLAYYYAAFCQVNYTYMEQDKSKVDAIADKASELIDKADALQPNNSEISCIKSMIATSHMMVNPMQRFQEYGPEAASYLDAATQQDATNPRPEYLKGQGLKYTPEQFGGGCAVAKPVLQSSLTKYNAFKPASEIHPSWGKQRVESLLGECK
jgi:DNA uptake protein ComE-like DNA-binding protein